MARQRVSEQTVLFISIVKWVSLASVIGLIVGFTSAGFVRLLEFSTARSSAYWYLLFTIPLSLFIVALIKKYFFPEHDVETTNQVIDSIHHAKVISWQSSLKAFFLPIITIAGGGSAGKEAPCADVGASVGSLLSKWLRFSEGDRRKLMICGVSAGFAAVFGTPIAGAIFGVEFLYVGGMLYEVLLPSIVSGIVSYHVASGLGIAGFSYIIPQVPLFGRTFFITIIGAGIFFGIVSFLMVEVNRSIRDVSLKSNIWPPLKAFLAGTVVAAVAFFFSTSYLGLGMETIDLALKGGTIVLYAFLIKIVVTSITTNFGGSGGLITPSFFVGATAGALFASLFGLDQVIFAAVGMAAVLGGVANTPIAASILAIEAFGPAIAPYAAVACVISFLMTGHRSLFPSQVLSIQKSSSLKVVSGRNLQDTKTRVVVRKRGVLQYALKAEKHRKNLEKSTKKVLRGIAEKPLRSITGKRRRQRRKGGDER